MILPTKGIPPDRALLTVGGEILRRLDEPKTVSRVWDELRRVRTPLAPRLTFDWFILALDLLWLVGAVEFDKGRLTRAAVEEGAA
jgi:hypothetical protein